MESFMLYGLVLTVFVLLCFVLILLILLQKGKSSLGLGGLGGGSQLLFGGSGGQDLFQTLTWYLGTAFMVLSLLLAVMKRPSSSGLLTRMSTQQTATPTVTPQPIATQQPVEAPTPQQETTPAA